MPEQPGKPNTDVSPQEADEIMRRVTNMSDRSAAMLLMEQAQDNARMQRETHTLVQELGERFTGCENAVLKQTLRLDTYDRRFGSIERRQERMETAQAADTGRITRLEAWKDEKVNSLEGRRNWLKWLIQTTLGSSILAGIWHYFESIARHK